MSTFGPAGAGVAAAAEEADWDAARLAADAACCCTVNGGGFAENGVSAGVNGVLLFISAAAAAAVDGLLRRELLEAATLLGVSGTLKGGVPAVSGVCGLEDGALLEPVSSDLLAARPGAVFGRAPLMFGCLIGMRRDSTAAITMLDALAALSLIHI